MNLLIDHADIKFIKKLYEYYQIDGVTTNPTILSRTNRKPFEVLKEIRNFLPESSQLHVQVISTNAENIIQEAHCIQAVLGKQTHIKIPVTKEGLKAIRELKKENIPVTATIVLTLTQGYLAAKAGADYIAPYVNRMDMYSMNGIETVKKLQHIIDVHGYKTKILGASFKNCQQIIELANHGISACTISPDVIEQFLSFEPVAIQIDKFTHDFEELCGKDRTMIEESGR